MCRNSSTETMTHDVFDDHTAQYKENLIPNVGQVACKELIASAATESLSIQHEAGELLEGGLITGV